MYSKKFLSDFLLSSSYDSFGNKKPKIVVIYGPTACGKTGLSIEIAKKLETEIISTDSRQIFCEMDIGTGKIIQAEKQGIVHHMIDICNPDQEYSVGAFKKEAERHIQELHHIGKIPLLVGGTGLYIDSLIYDFSLSKLPSDHKLRSELDLLSNVALFERLEQIDPEYSKELHPNNRPYIERAIEVKLLTGKSKRDFRQEKTLLYDTLFLTPYDGDRGVLYARIEQRIDAMLEGGLLDEITSLLKKYKESDFGMDTIGYREFFPYLSGEISLDSAICQVKQNTRNYAKRQCTWFSKYGKNQ